MNDLLIKIILGKHRGFAFVEFEKIEDANAAIDNMVKIILITIIEVR